MEAAERVLLRTPNEELLRFARAPVAKQCVLPSRHARQGRATTALHCQVGRVPQVVLERVGSLGAFGCHTGLRRHVEADKGGSMARLYTLFVLRP
jgi:hypothetical protein